jgi:hypothetical protein
LTLSLTSGERTAAPKASSSKKSYAKFRTNNKSEKQAVIFTRLHNIVEIGKAHLTNMKSCAILYSQLNKTAFCQDTSKFARHGNAAQIVSRKPKPPHLGN